MRFDDPLAGYVSAQLPGAGMLPDLSRDALPTEAWTAAKALVDGGAWSQWSALAARIGWCTHPVNLRGSSMTRDSATGVVETFASSSAPDGLVRVPCGNRRADKCPACSRVYARDTFELIRAGLVGGKQVPGSVADNPLVFATLTAPSFGHVHGVRGGGPCRPRRGSEACPHGHSLSCHAAHRDGEEVVGSPMCWGCYDWASAVVWQWHAPELWRRMTIALRRGLAGVLGVHGKELRRLATVQYAKVAEFQARGLVHFHALIRLDGPDGPGSPSPLDGMALASLVEQAVRSVRVEAPPVDGADVPRVLRFGAQLDVRTVRTGRPGDVIEDARSSEQLRAEQVAGYLAKYSTKAAGEDGVLRPHLERMQRECWSLAKRGRAHRSDSPYVLLSKWGKMLGFRGHFSTKSRAYSVTLGRLRAARRRFARMKAETGRGGVPLDVAELEERLLAEEDTTLVISASWEFVGCGWRRPGEKELAEAAAARAREYARWQAEIRWKGFDKAGEGDGRVSDDC